MAYAIIWAKTTYDTGKCRKCGRVLREGDTLMPSGDVLLDEAEGRLFCPSCMTCCAKMVKSDKSVDELRKEAANNGGRYPEDFDV